MKIVIKKEALGLKLLVITNALCWYHFFYVLRLPFYLSQAVKADNLIFINAVIGLLTCLHCYNNYHYRMVKYSNWLSNYFLLVMVAYITMCIYTAIVYPKQDLFTTLKLGSTFLQLLFVPAFLVIFEVDGGEKNLINILDNIVFIWCIVLIAQSALYSASGSFLFDFNSYYLSNIHGGVATRSYGIRASIGCLGNFCILYNFSNLYSHKIDGWRRTWTLLKFIVEIYCLIAIQQTRAWYLIIAICILVQILLGRKSVRVRVIESLAIITVVALLFFSGAIQNFIQNLSAVSVAEDSMSSSNRIYAITYYVQTFIKKPLFGNGFVSCTAGSPYFAVEHGNLGIAYYGDVGIFGLLAETGIFSIIYFIYPFFKIIESFKTLASYKFILGTDFNFYVSLIFYLLLSSVTLIIVNDGRAYLFPIIMAIFLYNEKKCLQGDVECE